MVMVLLSAKIGEIIRPPHWGWMGDSQARWVMFGSLKGSFVKTIFGIFFWDMASSILFILVGVRV